MSVVVIRTGVANLASILAGLRRAGADATLTTDPQLVRDAARVILPGVGAFGAGMAVLREHGLDRAIVQRVEQGRPLMAVCLGLQLLARTSEETPGVDGLGILDVAVTRFVGDVRIPQLGWNRVSPSAECTLIEPGYAYFANSFHLDGAPAGWAIATTDHAGAFPSAIERGPILGCQFHPELSGSWGTALMTRWLDRSKEGSC